jgi:intracellular sulfur oxidation DsrE/DsrF family protein
MPGRLKQIRAKGAKQVKRAIGLFFACIAVLTIGAAGAQSLQPQPYKVVFDLTSPDPLDQQAVLRWIKEVSALNPKTKIEVVMYGRGLDLAVSGKTALEAGVKEAMGQATFAVCAIAMKNQKLEASQLLANVQIVPDGIGEIVAKQHAGWGYIKVGH